MHNYLCLDTMMFLPPTMFLKTIFHSYSSRVLVQVPPNYIKHLSIFLETVDVDVWWCGFGGSTHLTFGGDSPATGPQSSVVHSPVRARINVIL